MRFPRQQAVQQKTLIGTRLQAVGTYPDDGTGIIVEIDLNKTFGEPEIIDSTVRSTLTGEQLPVKEVRIEQGSIKTKLRLNSGAPQILGTINQPGEAGMVGIVVLEATAFRNR